MSSITALAGSYYQLPTGSSSSQTSGGTSASSLSSALLQALQGQSGSTSTSSDAYTLNLSPEAQNYLLSGSSNLSTGTQQPASFTLSTSQQQQLTAIIAKYKDAPYTQDTFNAIQNDLPSAGLGASQLAQQDQAKNFNPTQLLIDDLGGNFSAADQLASGDSSAEQSKSSAYMQQVLTQWQNVSGNTGAAAPAASGTAATA